jgi:hypothetical protein
MCGPSYSGDRLRTSSLTILVRRRSTLDLLADLVSVGFDKARERICLTLNVSIGVGGGYCWGESYWDSASALTDTDTNLELNSIISTLTITSVGQSSGIRGQFVGLGINDILLGFYGGRGKYKNV